MGSGVRSRLWQLTRRVFFAVRTGALFVGLVLAYFVGVGLTRLLTLPLPARWLGVRRRRKAPSWIEPEPGATLPERLDEPF